MAPKITSLSVLFSFIIDNTVCENTNRITHIHTHTHTRTHILAPFVQHYALISVFQAERAIKVESELKM